jgi:hypothetical protein
MVTKKKALKNSFTIKKKLKIKNQVALLWEFFRDYTYSTSLPILYRGK